MQLEAIIATSYNDRSGSTFQIWYLYNFQWSFWWGVTQRDLILHHVIDPALFLITPDWCKTRSSYYTLNFIDTLSICIANRCKHAYHDSHLPPHTSHTCVCACIHVCVCMCVYMHRTAKNEIDSKLSRGITSFIRRFQENRNQLYLITACLTTQIGVTST
jgi:hypothetical protein